ncbi:hypothetical protein, partial [Bacillus cereus group sp. BC232]|uniref:hypothetical protein n=1 Tax=Bacillus cereus group sp. BC232 TaxID=3445338 RepID=UPI003F1F89FC
MKTKLTALFANISDTTECLFLNEATVEEDGWAQLAPFGDFPGKAMVTGADGKTAKIDAIQRIDKPVAEAMVAKFNSVPNRIRRFVSGVN